MLPIIWVMRCFHPEPDYLERYALGRLNGEDDIRISKHLAECGLCFDITDKLLSNTERPSHEVARNGSGLSVYNP